MPIASSICGKCASMTWFSSRRNPRCLRCPPAARMLFPRCPARSSSCPDRTPACRSAPSASCSPPQPGQFLRLSALSRFPRRGRQRALFLLVPPVLEMGVVKPLAAHQLAALGLPSGSASYSARIRALYAAVNVRRFGRSGWLRSPDHHARSSRPGQRVSSSLSRWSCLALLNLRRISTSLVSHEFDREGEPWLHSPPPLTLNPATALVLSSL